MKPVELETHQADDRDLMAAQARIKEFAQAIEDCPLIDGALVEGVEMAATGLKTIEHRLGRKPIGWMVARQNAYAFFREETDGNSIPEKVILIRSTHAVTANFWFF